MESPRERRQQRTRQAILDAALKIIVAEGADNLSLRELARKVDYSPAGLYEYFGSKDEIVEAVCEEGNARLAAYLNAADASLPTDEYLVEIGMAYVRFSQDNPEMFTLMFSHLSGPKRMITPETLDDRDAFTPVYRSIQTAIDAGLIAVTEGGTTMDIAYGMWALVHGLAVLQMTHLRNFPLDFPFADRQAMETFVRGWITRQ